MNQLLQTEEGSLRTNPITPREIARDESTRKIMILRRVLVRCCAGQELGFFFIPKRSRNLIRNFTGSMRVVTLANRTLHSFPITYPAFSILIKLLEKPAAFDKRKAKKPMCFRMRAKVPHS